MKGEVRIRIVGSQIQENGEKDETIQSFMGRYHREGPLHCLAYKEDLEGGAYILHTIRFGRKEVLIHRRGSVSTILRLEKGCRHRTEYRTPYGGIDMELETRDVQIEEAEGRTVLNADYHMYLEGAYFAACQITVEVTEVKSEKE